MKPERSHAAAVLFLFIVAGVVVGLVQPVARPRLVLLLAVDQLRYDYLTRFPDLYQGGFRTLLDRGALFAEARFRHAMTLTAPGHATISTGLHPSHHGVTANNWYDPSLGRSMNAVEDPAYEPVGGPGRKVSPRTLLADTFGDRLKQASPASKVVGIATKDRAAVLLTGRKADAAYWYSNECGCFNTSTYYMKEPPEWLVRFNEVKPATRYHGKPWERLLDDAPLYQEHSREDAFPSEFDGQDITFPHRLPSSPPHRRYYERLRRTPQAEQLVLEAALEVLTAHKLGTDDTTDLLAVGFSSTDYVGHDFGPFSQEAMDQQLRLDRLLGKLLAAVDDRVGLEQVLVVLTADHGVLPLVEEAKRQGQPARLVPPNALPDAVNTAVAKRYPELQEIVVYFDSPHMFLDLQKIEQEKIARSEVEAVVEQALLSTGFVQDVYTHAEMQGEPPPNDLFWRLYRNSFHARRSPHLMVRLKEFQYLEGSQGATGHGSPYDYDLHVPIIFMGAGIPPGKHTQPCGPESIAPTLSQFFGIKMPLEPDGRQLTEILHK